MASSDEKSLAVGHISGFQIDPNLKTGKNQILKFSEKYLIRSFPA